MPENEMSRLSRLQAELCWHEFLDSDRQKDAFIAIVGTAFDKVFAEALASLGAAKILSDTIERIKSAPSG